MSGEAGQKREYHCCLGNCACAAGTNRVEHVGHWVARQAVTSVRLPATQWVGRHVIRQQCHITQEESCRDERLDWSEIPPVPFTVFLMEQQSAMNQIVGFNQPDGWLPVAAAPLAVVIGAAQDDLFREDQPFHLGCVALFLAHTLFHGVFRFKPEQAFRPGWFQLDAVGNRRFARAYVERIGRRQQWRIALLILGHGWRCQAQGEKTTCDRPNPGHCPSCNSALLA